MKLQAMVLLETSLGVCVGGEGLASGWLDLEGAWGSLHSANPVSTPLHMFPPVSHTVWILDRTLMRSASGSCGDTGGRRAGMTFLLRPREVNHAHFPGMDPQRKNKILDP